jgi:hypothetical protein
LILLQRRYGTLDRSSTVLKTIILRQSTDWPAGTEFGFIVQHQNIQLQYELPLDGDVQAEYSLFPQFDPLQEVFIFSETHTAWVSFGDAGVCQ